MKDIKIFKLDDLLDRAKDYITDSNELVLIKDAYLFAESKHFGQKRMSGEDYIQHPLNAAIILTSIYADVNTIAAALLHDTVEDCDVGIEEIEEKFGPTVSKLVDNVTKISKLNFNVENEYIANNYRKVIIGMSEDVRTIIIKLADRLHNMRTLWALPREKQKRIAKETLEILAPLAHRLGIHKIKSDLEDLSLKYLKPDIYYNIVEKINATKKERDNSVNLMISSVSKMLDENNIEYDIKGRAKSIYSIYKKLDDGRRFEDIYDLLAIRVLVKTEQDCYTALGLIHSKYKPLPNRFKDYIAQPKPNMYQSLHTTIFGEKEFLFEVQIRTYDMNEIAEFGIASHAAYKEKGSKSQAVLNAVDKKMEFFREILEIRDNTVSSEEFLETLQSDILSFNIYVYTPSGDVIELPKGATPIDFAYKVHTEVGNKMIGAIVNSKQVPFDYELSNGDIVKINTSKSSNGPKLEWIDIATTAGARGKIKSFHSKNEKEERIESGEKLLLNEIRKRKLAIKDTVENKLDKFLKEYKINDLEELYYYIGNDKYSPSEVLNFVFDEIEEEVIISDANIKNTTSVNDVLVSGMSDIKITIASCCEPIPGDDIIGYITKTRGICVHRNNCRNTQGDENRIIDVSWNNKTTRKYVTTLVIYAVPNSDLLLDIATTCKNLNIPIHSINNINSLDENMYKLSVVLKDTKQLEGLVNAIDKLKLINSIKRFIN